jgi:hypothetical protein
MDQTHAETTGDLHIPAPPEPPDEPLLLAAALAVVLIFTALLGTAVWGVTRWVDAPLNYLECVGVTALVVALLSTLYVAERRRA